MKNEIKIDNKMKLSTLLMVSFFIVSLVGSIVLVGYSSNNYNKISTEGIHKHLSDIVKIRASHIITFLEGKTNRVIDFSSDGFIKNSLIELKRNNSEKLMRELSEYLVRDKIVLDESFYEIEVLDHQGKIVGGANSEDEFGEDFSEDLIFLKGKEATYVKEYFYDEEFERDGITISSPISDKGEFLGIIIIKMTLDELREIITSAGEFSKFEELYILDRDSFMITPSKFLGGENKGILTQKVDTKNSNDCFIHLMQGIDKHPVYADYLDYRGEKVIGTHDTLSDNGWCLLVEIELEGGLKTPQKEFLKSQIIVSAFLITILTLIGFFVGKYFDKKFLLSKEKENEK